MEGADLAAVAEGQVLVAHAEEFFYTFFTPPGVEETDTPFTSELQRGQVLRAPIAHGEGNYYAEPEVVAALEKNRQVVFRYVDEAGDADALPAAALRAAQLLSWSGPILPTLK